MKNKGNTSFVRPSIVRPSLPQIGINTDHSLNFFKNYGDLQPLPEVDQSPHFEVPYPTTNGDNDIRRPSGSCPFQPLHKSSPSNVFFMLLPLIGRYLIYLLFMFHIDLCYRNEEVFGHVLC